jgi:predicted MFS family arabinose efflux permease
MLLGTLLPILSASAASVLLSAACFGASIFIAPSAVAVLVRKTTAPDQWAKGMIFYTVLFAVGQAIGPVLSGWVADHVSLNASMAFAAALLGLALLRTGGLEARLRSHGLRPARSPAPSAAQTPTPG